MRAVILKAPQQPLEMVELPEPVPGMGQVLIRVNVCGVCRTDLHVVDGDLKEPKLPIIPGHQIVGRVVQAGPGARQYKPGSRVGVPWLGGSCGTCTFCRSGRENLCDHARYTGYQIDGGFAEFCVADGRFCFPIPEEYPDLQAAPLLCAGLIGYRAYRISGDVPRLGFYGFGAAAHILIQVARHQGREVFVFTRQGDAAGQQFARKLGASWVGASEEMPPKSLDAAIIFAPVGELVPLALKAVTKGS